MQLFWAILQKKDKELAGLLPFRQVYSGKRLRIPSGIRSLLLLE